MGTGKREGYACSMHALHKCVIIGGKRGDLEAIH